MSVTEDYCSFELSKLLKEKGFDEYCLKNYWSTDKELHDWNWKLSYHRNSDGNRNTRDCAAPTLQMTMKWLREKHNLNVEVYRTACGFIGCIVAIPSGTDIKFLEDDGDDLPSGQYTTYEKACESAIKYCLTNLI